MFCVLFLPTAGLGLKQFFKKVYVLRTNLEVWRKWIVFVPDFPLSQIPIKLHNIVLRYLAFHYSLPPKIWRSRDTK